MTRNRLLREVGVVLAFCLFVFFGFCSEAQAQLVQPTYVRPSKGAAINVFPGSDGKGLAPNAVVTYSAVFDFSAFEAVQVFVSARSTTGAQCTAGFAGISVFVAGSFTKTGASTPGGFFILSDPYAAFTRTNFTSNDDSTYSVGSLPTYLQIAAGPVGANADASCRLQVNIIPDPFVSTMGVQGRTAAGAQLPLVAAFPVLVGGSDYNGGSAAARTLRVNTDGSINIGSVNTGRWFYENTAPVTVATGATATRILTVDGNEQGARFQNVGSVPVYCGPRSTTSTTSYQFSLKASASPDDGTGGVIDLPNKGQPTSGFWCAVSGATTGKVAVMRIERD